MNKELMNKELRNLLNEISLTLSNLMDDYLFQLKKVIEEEEEAFNNLPESLQDSTKGIVMMDRLDTLHDAISELEDTRDYLQGAIEE